MRYTKLYHWADAGGEGGGGEGAPGATAGAEGQAGSGAEGGEKNQTGNNKPEAPPSGDKPKKMSDEDVAKLIEEHDSLKTDHEKIKKKLGKQAQTVGNFNEMMASLKADPTAGLKALAKRLKAKGVRFEDDAPDPTKIFDGEAEPSSQAAQLQAIVDHAKESLRQEQREMLNPVLEDMLARQHDDWDDLSDDRTSVEALHVTGKILNTELYHFAAKGMNVAEAIEAAKTQAVEDYKQELSRKNNEHLEGGGAAGGEEGGGDKMASIEQVLDQLPIF